MNRTLIAVAALAALAGCDLYFHGDPGKECPLGGALAGTGSASWLRDPSTGLCGNYGNDNTDPSCEPCGGPCEEPPIVQLDYPECNGACDGLAETVCAATAGCHVALNDTETGYAGCWNIGPLVPIEGGACADLDPFTCAQHDDCATFLTGDAGNAVASCQAEPGTPDCATLTTEFACLSQTGCEAVYAGTDCTCTSGSACTCENETFERCESAFMDPTPQ